MDNKHEWTVDGDKDLIFVYRPDGNAVDIEVVVYEKANDNNWRLWNFTVSADEISPDILDEWFDYEPYDIDDIEIEELFDIVCDNWRQLVSYMDSEPFPFKNLGLEEIYKYTNGEVDLMYTLGECVDIDNYREWLIENYNFCATCIDFLDGIIELCKRSAWKLNEDPNEMFTEAMTGVVNYDDLEMLKKLDLVF